MLTVRRTTTTFTAIFLVAAALLAIDGTRPSIASAQTCAEPTLGADDPRAVWVEGTMAADDGATRDFYNRAAMLAWDRPFGDWVDMNGNPGLAVPYALTALQDDDAPGPHTWDVTTLVEEWLDGTPNQGLSMQRMGGNGPFDFHSREHPVAAERPKLIVTTSSGTFELEPVADTSINTLIYQHFRSDTSLRVANGEHHTLIRFELSSIPPTDTVQSAALQLWSYAEYGGTPFEVGAFRVFHDPGALPLAQNGLAYSYDSDTGLESHPDVYEVTTFADESWADVYRNTDSPTLDLVGGAPGFAQLDGQALEITVPTGDNFGSGFAFKFAEQTGSEPEEIYFRYYIRIDSNWNPTYGGKFPGISGTYGVAGWGGRRSDGSNGWSARGGFHPTVPKSANPLGDTVPIGHYVYHADQTTQWGDNVLWQDAYLGYLDKNRWYSIEQHLVLNTPGVNDGILQTWIDGRLAYRDTDWRWRDTSDLKIEQIWMNVYHGGTAVPDEDISLYIDNVVISETYIGPMKGAPCAPTSGRFADDDNSIFEADIEKLAAAGITKGCNPPTNDHYCPDDSVTRGQMAAFLVRALGLSASSAIEFVDDDDSIFVFDIEKLAEAGITRGCNPPINDHYCPGDSVTRGQMAAFLARALELPPGPSGVFVDDDDSVFQADIEALAEGGITRGCNPPINDRYCPVSPVTRSQMAAFLVRALGL